MFSPVFSLPGLCLVLPCFFLPSALLTSWVRFCFWKSSACLTGLDPWLVLTLGWYRPLAGIVIQHPACSYVPLAFSLSFGLMSIASAFCQLFANCSALSACLSGYLTLHCLKITVQQVFCAIAWITKELFSLCILICSAFWFKWNHYLQTCLAYIRKPSYPSFVLNATYLFPFNNPLGFYEQRSSHSTIE